MAMRVSVSWGEARLVVLGGVMLGLAVAFFPTDLDWNAPVAPVRENSASADPYAEARASRAILRAQEGVPRSSMRDARSTDDQIRVAAPHGVEVIDGDTFRYAGQTIRIADIDTPELRGRCAYESALAARATARMAQLLRKGPFELSPVERDTDQYGRKLRVVTRGGRSLGDQLVAEGLARTWTGRREPWCLA